MTDDLKETIIEAATSAFRERSSFGRIVPSPAWWDLAEDERVLAFERQLEIRQIDRSLNPKGHSSTVRAVLCRLARMTP